MGPRQTFTAAHASGKALLECLERFAEVARLERVACDLVVFSLLPGEPAFASECKLTPSGFRSDRAGA